MSNFKSYKTYSLNSTSVTEEASLCEDCGKIHEEGECEYSEARVKPSPETQKMLVKPMTRGAAADLKRSLNNSVDGLDGLVWKLQYQYDGIDAKAIAQLKATYKEALKMQKLVAKAIDSAK